MTDTENIQIHVDPVVYSSAPDPEGRLPKEMAVYALLDKLNIPYERVDHDAAHTMEQCVAVEKVLGTRLCKNLFLRNQKKTTFFLLMLPAEKMFSTAEFSKKIGVSRLSFAEDSYMEELLNITPGFVSLFGLMNDKDEYVELIVDKELLEDEYIGCHPCINTSTLKIRTSDIQKFAKKVGHRMTTVKL